MKEMKHFLSNILVLYIQRQCFTRHTDISGAFNFYPVDPELKFVEPDSEIESLRKYPASVGVTISHHRRSHEKRKVGVSTLR